MPATLGYLITWTTYGTWLQGDEGGYVKNGKTLSPNPALANANANNLTQAPVELSKDQQRIAHSAITTKAKELEHSVLALSVTEDHFHLVMRYSPTPIGKIVAYYKNAVRIALRATGLQGKIWSTGYDKRFCFDNQSLKSRITYVKNHKNT